MVGVAFSLTVGLTIDPILTMTEYFADEPANCYTVPKKIFYFVKTEIASRIVAVSISIFAVGDAVIHFSACAYKASYLLLGKIVMLPSVTWDMGEIEAHLRMAALFIGICLIGSIAASIWPSVVCYFPHNEPSEKLDYEPAATAEICTELGVETEYMRQAREAVGHLKKKVIEGSELPPFENLVQFWLTSLLFYRHWFVRIFSLDLPQFAPIRQVLKNQVYRTIGEPHVAMPTRWLSPWEIEEEVSSIFSRANAYSQAFYYHNTTQGQLEQIMRTNMVSAREGKPYSAAFVSTRPVQSLGSCILAFNRNIERLSLLNHGFSQDDKTYWAGFSKPIPVRKDTLPFVILNSRSEYARNLLEVRCSKLAERKIKVVLLHQVKDIFEQITNLGLGIPKEWPHQDAFVGGEILKELHRETELRNDDTEYLSVLESVEDIATKIVHVAADIIEGTYKFVSSSVNYFVNVPEPVPDEYI